MKDTRTIRIIAALLALLMLAPIRSSCALFSPVSLINLRKDPKRSELLL